MIKIKRAYDSPSPRDGIRILVDRLWPRGITKAKLKMDRWIKTIAPSTELRKSFGHDPSHWQDFERRYKQELRSPDAREAIADLRKQAKSGTVTLLFAAHDVEHNNAVVLKRILEKRSTTKKPRKAS